MSLPLIICLSIYGLYAILMLIFVTRFIKRMSFLKNEKIISHSEMRGFTRADYSKWSCFHFYIGSLILLPLRACIMFPLIFLTYIILKIFSFLFCTYRYETKLNKCFKFICNALITIICRINLFVMGFYWLSREIKKPKLSNLEYFDDVGEVNYANIVSNHTSWIDIFFFLAQPKSIGFISNMKVKNYFFIGFISQLIQCVFVDRQNKESRSKCFTDLMERANKIKKNPQCKIYIK